MQFENLQMSQIHTVTDLIKALPRNGSVNTFQQAMIGTGFSVASC
jgi:hypothetical protein